MWIWWSALALAGYGDPDEGPTLQVERAVHFWTNAARLAPEHWTTDYAQSQTPCSLEQFTTEERSPQLPLRWSPALGEVARAHSADQASTGQLSHDSSDGTAWNVRIETAYGFGVIGENVSRDYLNGRQAVLEGWMCSSDGHRGTLMDPGYTEIGVGVVDGYYTQDFGGAEVDARALNAGLIDGYGDTVQAMVDWRGDAAPTDLVAWVNGEEVVLELLFGRPEAGVYGAPVSPDEESGCLEVWFEGGGERYPEDGSLGAAGCDYDDAAAGWLDRQTSGGCSHGGGLAGLGPVALALLLMRRRRPASRG